ncbi:protein kinase [Streptomyces sp. SX92]|nr:protein kinase [Streptomyces coralus]
MAQLGRGGMGVVWRAADEVLGREVAVKELRTYTDADGPELAGLRLRMQREARAAARVRHPGVVAVHDVTEVDGRPLIVMELVDGPSLDDVLRERGTLDPREVAGIGAKVLDALAAAHSVGVLHRDVKPGNILLDRSGRVVLTDFGIATMEDPGDGSATHLTRSGELVGSLDYLAPERAQGADPGPASDIWALGATLYAAVEGSSPFRRTSTFSTLTAIVSEPLPEPRRAGHLGPVLQRLLDKRPEGRPGAEEARALLQSVADTTGTDLPTTTLRGPATPGNGGADQDTTDANGGSTPGVTSGHDTAAAQGMSGAAGAVGGAGQGASGGSAFEPAGRDGSGATGAGGSGPGTSGAPGFGPTGQDTPSAPGFGPYDQSTPGQGTPGQGIQAQGTPGHGTQAQGTPAQGTQDHSTPAHNTPAPGTAAQGAPGAPGFGPAEHVTPPGSGFGAQHQDTPGQGNPGQGTPSQGTPGQGTPSFSTPAHGSSHTPGTPEGHGAPGHGQPAPHAFGAPGVFGPAGQPAPAGAAEHGHGGVPSTSPGSGSGVGSGSAPTGRLPAPGTDRPARRKGRVLLAAVAVTVVLAAAGVTVSLVGDSGDAEAGARAGAGKASTGATAATPDSANGPASPSHESTGPADKKTPSPGGTPDKESGTSSSTGGGGAAPTPTKTAGGGTTGDGGTTGGGSGDGGTSGGGGSVGGGGGGETTPAPACVSIGGGKYNCEVWRTATSYTASGSEVGVLKAGTNYFYCQANLGRRETYGEWTNVWWAKTDDDSGNTGVYVSDVYVKGGDNDAPVPGLPVC